MSRNFFIPQNISEPTVLKSSRFQFQDVCVPAGCLGHFLNLPIIKIFESLMHQTPHMWNLNFWRTWGLLQLCSFKLTLETFLFATVFYEITCSTIYSYLALDCNLSYSILSYFLSKFNFTLLNLIYVFFVLACVFPNAFYVSCTALWIASLKGATHITLPKVVSISLSCLC